MELSYLDDAVVPASDLTHLMNTVLRAAEWDKHGNHVLVVITARAPTGWLEYGINVTRTDKSRVIYIGAIQRSIHAPSEFHS